MVCKIDNNFSGYQYIMIVTGSLVYNEEGKVPFAVFYHFYYYSATECPFIGVGTDMYKPCPHAGL